MIFLSALVMVIISIGQTRFPVAAIIVQNDQLNRFLDLSERNGQFVLTLVKPDDWVLFSLGLIGLRFFRRWLAMRRSRDVVNQASCAEVCSTKYTCSR